MRRNILLPDSRRTMQTVTVRYSLAGGTEGGPVSLVAANWELAQRGLMTFPGDVIAARLRVRNYSQSTSLAYANTLNVTGFWMGLPSFTSVPQLASPASVIWQPYFKSPPSLVVPSFTTDAAGAETVSNWITDRAVLPRRGVLYGWSMGMLSPTNPTTVALSSSGDTLHFGRGGGNYLGISTSAQAGAAHLPNGEIAATGPGGFLDVRLEVVMAMMPVAVAIGDSILAGSTADFAGAGPAHNAFGQAGIRNGFAAQNMGVGGSVAQGWAGADPLTDWRYQRFDWRTSPPDVVLLQHGYNDINTGALTDIQLEGYQQTLIDNVRKLAPLAKIYLKTLIPGSFASASAKETYRQSYNAWARSLPYGISGVIDWDDAMNPAGLCALVGGNVVGNTLYMTNGNPHPKRAAQSVLAQRIPSFTR